MLIDGLNGHRWPRAVGQRLALAAACRGWFAPGPGRRQVGEVKMRRMHVTQVSRGALGPVPKAGPDHWWDGPLKVLRVVLTGLDWVATKVTKLLSYGAH
jgi:hypothetical protein